MRSDRLNCPNCRTPYPIGRLVRQITWRMPCPACGTLLAFTQASAGRLGSIAGLSFGVIIVLVGPQRIMSWLSWPAIAFFILFAFACFRILSALVLSLDIAPEKASFDPFPEQRGVFKAFAIVGVSGMTLGGLAGFFLNDLSLRGHLIHIGIIGASLILTVIGLGNRTSAGPGRTGKPASSVDRSTD